MDAELKQLAQEMAQQVAESGQEVRVVSQFHFRQDGTYETEHRMLYSIRCHNCGAKCGESPEPGVGACGECE